MGVIMATVYWSGKILVRRKGAITSVTFHGSELEDRNVFIGDRRSRQIGRRHWLCKVTSYTSSNESLCGTDVTIKLPYMEKPVQCYGRERGSA